MIISLPFEAEQLSEHSPSLILNSTTHTVVPTKTDQALIFFYIRKLIQQSKEAVENLNGKLCAILKGRVLCIEFVNIFFSGYQKSLKTHNNLFMFRTTFFLRNCVS